MSATGPFFVISIVARYSILKGRHPTEKCFTFGHFLELAVEFLNGICDINQTSDCFRIFEINRQCCPVIMPRFIDFKVLGIPFILKQFQII